MLCKKFINSSLNLRTFSTQLNVNRFCKFNTITKATSVKHVSSQNLEANEVLHNQLKTIVIPVKVLECLLETNGQQVRGKNIADAINCLVKLCKQEKIFKLENKLIIERILYNLINDHKDKILLNDAVDILKQLMRIRISNSSEIVHIILEIINNSLHELEFKDYIFVSETLVKMKETNLTKNLYNGLQQNFEQKIATELDASNLDTLTEIFRYATNHLNDKKVFQVIIDNLDRDNFKSISVANAVSIMKSLCTMTPFPHRYVEFLQKIQNILINNINEVTIDDIKSILFKISVRNRVDKVNEYYNSSLLDLFAQKIILGNIDFNDAVNCLRSFITCRHVPKNLLNYIGTKHHEKRQMNQRISTSYLEKLLCFLNGLALIKHKPIFWEEIQSDLKISKILTFTDEMLVNYSLNLSCLDCYNLEVLKRIFQAQYKYIEKPFLHWRLLYLWQHLKNKSIYSGPLPLQGMVESFKLLNRMRNLYPLLPSLNEIVGDKRYIKTNTRTKFYHQIDHVLIFDAKDKPVAINHDDDESDDYLEDLKVSDNSKIVAIVYLPQWWYLANVNELLGPFEAYVQSLKTLNPHIVVVPEQVWQQLPEDSRTDFLKNEINSKLYRVTNGDF